MTAAWRTKPTDRFVLKWIKLYLSAPISSRLVRIEALQPWMITVLGTACGIAAGCFMAFGFPLYTALFAIVAQTLDGVDGQIARIRGRSSKGGAFLDSVLDRYSDGFLLIGTCIYVIRGGYMMEELAWAAAAFALVGSNAISYSTARADDLKLDLGASTFASKGTRTSVMIIAAIGAIFWAPLPAPAVIYLALHTTIAVILRIVRASR